MTTEICLQIYLKDQKTKLSDQQYLTKKCCRSSKSWNFHENKVKNSIFFLLSSWFRVFSVIVVLIVQNVT